MNTNAGTTHRLHGLPGPVAVSAAGGPTQLRGSPPGRYLAGSALLTALHTAGAGRHAAAVPEGRQS